MVAQCVYSNNFFATDVSFFFMELNCFIVEISYFTFFFFLQCNVSPYLILTLHSKIKMFSHTWQNYCFQKCPLTDLSLHFLSFFLI